MVPVEVSVVIPTWNKADLLVECLDALLPSIAGLATEVIVVDNGSTDDTEAVVRTRYPGVRLLRAPKNLGFAPAVNWGANEAVGKYLFILNNDAVLRPDTLERLVSFLEAQPLFFAAQGLIQLVQPANTIDSLGLGVRKYGAFFQVGHGEPQRDQYRQALEVFGVTGTAGLYRRSMWKELGGLAERFFAYHEDVDLAIRARVQGWRAAYVPTPPILHKHSATAGRDSPFKSFLLGRNKVRTIAGSFPRATLVRYAVPILGYDLMAAMASVVQSRSAAGLRGRWHAMKELPKTLQERRGRAKAKDPHCLDGWPRAGWRRLSSTP